MHLLVLAFFSHSLESLLNLVVWGRLVTDPLEEVFVLYLFICITICVHVYVVYTSGGYMEIIQRAAESSMQAAVSEVKCLPQYSK